jgi:hypothetical protein
LLQHIALDNIIQMLQQDKENQIKPNQNQNLIKSNQSVIILINGGVNLFYKKVLPNDFEGFMITV